MGLRTFKEERMFRFWSKRHLNLGNQRGFTLIELMFFVAIIGILAAIAIPLSANVQARARIAKAQADARALASAVSIYSAHVGNLPPTLAALSVSVSNAQGQVAGPFMSGTVATPTGWSPTYAYNLSLAAGTFNISATGDLTTVSLP